MIDDEGTVVAAPLFELVKYCKTADIIEARMELRSTRAHTGTVWRWHVTTLRAFSAILTDQAHAKKPPGRTNNIFKSRADPPPSHARRGGRLA